MTIPKIAAVPMNEWVKGMKFRQQLEAVLNSLKIDATLSPIIGRKRTTFEDDKKAGTVWIGLREKQRDFWIGFGIKEQDRGMEVFMLAHQAYQGDRTTEFRALQRIDLEPPEFVNQKTWLNIRRNLDDKIDGDGNSIRQWLLDAGKWLLSIN